LFPSAPWALQALSICFHSLLLIHELIGKQIKLSLIALLKVRRSLGYSSKFTSYLDDNLLEDFLLNNNVRCRFPEEDIFLTSLMREKNTSHGRWKVFVMTQKNGYKGLHRHGSVCHH